MYYFDAMHQNEGISCYGSSRRIWAKTTVKTLWAFAEVFFFDNFSNGVNTINVKLPITSDCRTARFLIWSGFETVKNGVKFVDNNVIYFKVRFLAWGNGLLRSYLERCEFDLHPLPIPRGVNVYGHIHCKITRTFRPPIHTICITQHGANTCICE